MPINLILKFCWEVAQIKPIKFIKMVQIFSENRGKIGGTTNLVILNFVFPLFTSAL